MASLKVGDEFPTGVTFSYVPYAEENKEVTSCGIPINYDASKGSFFSFHPAKPPAAPLLWTFTDYHVQNGLTRKSLSSLCKHHHSSNSRFSSVGRVPGSSRCKFWYLGEFWESWADFRHHSPGAFTPGCSARHLPPYIEKLPLLKAKGVDIVACIAFNDAWVMSAWGKANGVKDEIVRLLVSHLSVKNTFPQK